jgi:hypothetical protein
LTCSSSQNTAAAIGVPVSKVARAAAVADCSVLCA